MPRTSEVDVVGGWKVVGRSGKWWKQVGEWVLLSLFFFSLSFLRLSWSGEGRGEWWAVVESSGKWWKRVAVVFFFFQCGSECCVVYRELGECCVVYRGGA
jgi:hypothetical protein